MLTQAQHGFTQVTPSPCVIDLQEEKSQKSTLERIYSYELLLTKAMLDEGVSNLGDTTNLRRAMHKLVTGQ